MPKQPVGGGPLDSSPYVSSKPSANILDQVVPTVTPSSSMNYRGPVETRHDLGRPVSEEGDLPQIRNQSQSNWDAAGNMLLQTVSTVTGQTIDSIGAIMAAPKMAFDAASNMYNNRDTTEDYTNVVSQSGRDLQDWVQKLAPIYQDPNKTFSDPKWWMANAPSVASSLSMLIPMEGAAMAVGGLARFMRVSELAGELAQVGVGALAGRHAENYMEAGGVYKTVYQDAIANGVDPEKASRNAGAAASLDYSMNYANLAFDVIQLGAIIKPFKGLATIGEDLLGARAGAINKLGYEAANARALDMTGKSIFDGAKWYEKVAGQTLRYTRPLVGQLGEGVEEAINTMSQKEGERRGRILNGTSTADDRDTTWDERLNKYVVDKDVASSAFWGVLGGVAFEHVGELVHKAVAKASGKPIAEQSARVADIAARRNLISEYVKTSNDPTASPIDKLKTRHKNIFQLAKSAMANDNLDLLLGDMEDGTYQGLIAKQAGLDPTAAKAEIGKLKDDIQYISDAYSNYRGLNKQAWQKFNQAVEVSPFGDNDEIKKELVKRGMFQYVEPHLADHLTQLDYYSHKANTTSAESLRLINQEISKIDGGNNPHFKNVLDNHLRTQAIDETIKDYEKEIDHMMDAKVTDATIQLTKDQVANLKLEKEKLKKQRVGLKAIVDNDFENGGSEMNFDDLHESIDQATTVNEEQAKAGFINPLAQNYKSIIDDQMIKHRYARERSLMIKDPGKYYSDLIQDHVTLNDFKRKKDEEAKRYGYEEGDDATVKELKRRIVDVFADEVPADAFPYTTEKAAKEAIFKEAYEEFVKPEHDDLAEQLSGLQEHLNKFDIKKPEDFNFEDYTKTRATIEAIEKVIKERTPAVEAPVQTTSGGGEVNKSVEYGKAAYRHDINVAHSVILADLKTLKNPTEESALNDMINLQKITFLQNNTPSDENSKQLQKWVGVANDQFPTVFTGFEPNVVKALDESFATRDNDILKVLADVDGFINDFNTRVEKLKEEKSVEPVTSVIVDSENPTPENQFSPGDIVYDKAPEPLNINDSQELFEKEHEASTKKQDASLINPIVTNSENEGYLLLGNGGSLVSYDKNKGGFQYIDGLPVINPRFERGDSSVMDLSLLDPNHPDHLKAGDNIEIHYGSFNEARKENSLVVYKVTKSGDKKLIGYVDNSTNPVAKNAVEKVRKLAVTHKVLKAKLATNALSWGTPLTTERLNNDEKFLIPQPLSKVMPLSSVNKPGGPYLAIHNGSSFAVAPGGTDLVNVATVMPDKSFITTAVNPLHSGQFMAIIPTNHIPIGTSDEKRNDKVTYQARIIRTQLVSKMKTANGDNVATALIRKLIDPYKNQDFIKSLKTLLPNWDVDLDKPLEDQNDAMKKLYTKGNINFIMNRITYSKAYSGKADPTGKNTDDYKYPFYVDVAENKNVPLVNGKIVIASSLQVRYGTGSDKSIHYFEIGRTDFTNSETVNNLAAINKFTDAKPFRVDAKEIHKPYNSGSWTGFAIDNGDVVVKDYDKGYLQYIDDNGIAMATFASVPYTYHDGGKTVTRRSYFEVPKIKINLTSIEEYKSNAKAINQGPAEVGSSKRTINGFSMETITPNEPKNILRFLEESKNVQLSDDETEYVHKITGQKFKRVSNVLFKSPQESAKLEQAGKFGNSVDKFVRDFFSTTRTGAMDNTKYPGITPEIANKLTVGLMRLRMEFQKNGETVYSDNRVVFDSKTGVAGELDLMTVDQNNNVRIYDTKSLLGTVNEMKDNHPRIQKWRKQQNAYRVLLQNEFGIHVSSLEIIPVELGYGSENDNIVTVNMPGNVSLDRIDKVEGENGSIQMRDVTKDEGIINSFNEGLKNHIKPIPEKGTTPVSGKLPFNYSYTIEGGKHVVSDKNGKRIGEYDDFRKAADAAKADALSGNLDDADDSSYNIVGGIMNEIYEVDSIHSALQDPTASPVTRTNLLQIANTAIMDVLYDKTLGNGQKRLNVDTELKPAVYDTLKRNLDILKKQYDNIYEQLVEMQENGAEPEAIAYYEREIANYPSYINHHEKLLERFDNESFSPEVKAKVGEFIGYFKTAYFFVSGSKLVKTAGSEDEVFDLSNEPDNQGLSARYNDNWYASINPKDTVSFQTKVFLSRIPKTENGYKVFTNGGSTAYHDLNDVLKTLWSMVNEIRSDHFLEDLEDFDDNPIIKDMLEAFREMDQLIARKKGKWSFTKDQLVRKLAAATILQQRQTRILMFNRDEENDTSSSYAIDANRQKVEQQLIDMWESGFKNNIREFYEIENKEKDGIANKEPTVLKKRNHSIYKKVENAAEITIPTVAEVADLVGGHINDHQNDTRLHIYNQMVMLAEKAAANPGKTFDIVLPDDSKDYVVRDVNGNKLTELTKSDLQQLLNYVKFPQNVRISQTDADSKHYSGFEISSIAKALESELERSTNNGKSYSLSSYFMIAAQLRRMGVNVSEDPTQAVKVLQKLEERRGQGQKYRSYDPKAGSLKDFLQDNFLKFAKVLQVPSLLTSLDNPFGDFNLQLKTIARISKFGWPNVYSPNITNVGGDSEFTNNPHHYLSNRINQIKNDPKLRETLLQTPFAGKSTIIRELFKDEKALSGFDIFDYKGIKINNKATSNKDMNDLKQLIVDYSFFHNGEGGKSEDATGRGQAMYITAHGESKTSPLISLTKRKIDYDFIQDKDGAIKITTRKDIHSSPFYNDVFSQFRSELDRVLHAHKVISAINKVNDEKGFQAAIDFARKDYKEGYHFIVGDNKFLPGSAYKMFLFGSEMFNDKKGVIYKNGVLNENIQKLADNEEDADGMKAAKEAFDKYIDDFLTEVLNKHLKHLESYGDMFFSKRIIQIGKQGNPFYGAHFPMFDRSYIRKMNTQLVNAALSPIRIFKYDQNGSIHEEKLKPVEMQKDLQEAEYRGMSDEVKAAYKAEVQKISDKSEQSDFYEYHKRVIVADFLFNHLLFKNTYLQLTEDPADFSKSEKYDTLIEEMNKRLKHHLGPGYLSSEIGDNQLPILWYNDITPGQVKLNRPIATVQTTDEPHILDSINFMMNYTTQDGKKPLAKYVDVDNGHYKLPSNFEEIGALYNSHYGKDTKSKQKLAKIILENLNQKMTDGGTIVTTREIVTRMVKSGDIDINIAPEVYKILQDKNLNSKQISEILEKTYNVPAILVNKYIYSGNKINEYKEGDKTRLLNDFMVKKDSEVAMTPSLAKDTQWEPIIKHLEELEEKLLANKGIDLSSPQAFTSGLALSPLSARKSQGLAGIDLFNEQGVYTGNISKAPIQYGDRSQMREQQKKDLKDTLEITSSTQALPFSQLDVTSNMDLARVNNGPVKFKGSYTNVQLNNSRYSIYDELMKREMSGSYASKGIKVDDNGNMRMADLKKLVKSIRDQIVNQNGVGVVLEAFQVENNHTPIPLSFTPFGIVAQSVFLNGLSKNISSKKMPGQALIQMTAAGFNKSQVETDPFLKGFRIRTKKGDRTFDSRAAVLSVYTREELAKKQGEPWIEKEIENGLEVYRPMLNEVLPAEIAMSWNFRDVKGKLLPYEEYVNKDGTPKEGKIDPEFLKMISYRVPNTPHNTMAYTKVVRFLPPAHRDIVQVPSQIMTNMSSDLDVDTLYFYHYNYEIVNGKLNKVQGVLHSNQNDHESLINTTSNKELIRASKLKENYDYVATLQELRSKQAEYANIKGRLQEALEADNVKPVVELLANKETRAKYIKAINDYNEAESKMVDPDAEMRGLYYAVKSGDVDAREAFAEKYSEIVTGLQNEGLQEEDLEKAATDKLSDYVASLTGVVAQQEKDIKKGRGFKSDPFYMELTEQLKGEIKAIEKESESKIEALGSGEIGELHKKLDTIEEEFDKNFDFGSLSIYEKQSRQQLENAMLDSFMTLYSNPNIFKKMTSPLSTDFLKEKVTDNKLQWYEDGKLKSGSIEDLINNRGFSSINDYQSQANFKNNSSQNADMISVFASVLRSVQIAQNAGFFIAPEQHDEVPQMIYGKTEQAPDGKYKPKRVLVGGKELVEIKRDVAMNDDGGISDTADNMIYHQGGMSYKYHDKAYANGKLTPYRYPNQYARWRLDAIYDIDNYGNKVNVSSSIEAALQAVLDGIKDPIAPKIKLNMDNVNVFVGHVMLRYFDEIVPLLHQPIIADYERKVKQEGVKDVYITQGVIKTYIENYNNTNKVFDAAIVRKILDNDIDAIGTLELMLKDTNTVLTEADLNDMLVQYNEIDNTKRNELTKSKNFHYKQLAALLNYLKAEKIGKQITTIQIATNTFSKGMPANILEANDKLESFLGLHRHEYKNGKPTITTSVPNIGNIQNISTLLQQNKKESERHSTSNFYDLPVKNGLLPVVGMLKNMDTSVFTELTPVFNEMYDRYDEIRSASDERSRPGKRTKLATAMTSFIWSSPELYQDMFDTPEEFEFFKEYGRNAMMVHSEIADKLEEIKDKGVFVFDKTIAQAASDLSHEKMADGKTLGSVYKILNSFKYITGNSGMSEPDYILYMNIAELKGSFENEMAMSIPQMLNSKDARVRALAKQLILYSQMNGAISTPNSYVKHIPQSVKNKFNIDKRLRLFLNSINGGTNEYTRKIRNSVVDNFLLQYFQHNPHEAPLLDEKNLTYPKENTKSLWFVNPETKERMAYLRNDLEGLFDKNDGFVYKVMGKDGKMKLVVYDKFNDQPVMREVDKLGKSRWNSSEYQFSTININPGTSMVFENMSAGTKKELFSSKRDAIKDNQGKEDVVSMYLRGANSIKDLDSLKDRIGFYTTTPGFQGLTYILNTDKVPVSFINSDKGDAPISTNYRVGGAYNYKEDRVTMDMGQFFKADYSNVSGFEETALHEMMHANVDRAIISIMQPNVKLGGKKFFTKLETDKVSMSVNAIRKTVGILHSIMANEGLEGHKAIQDVIDRYDTMNEYQQAAHSFVPNVLMRMQELEKKGYSILNPDTNNLEEMNAVTAIMRETVATFMTNKNFQQLVNSVTIDDEFKSTYKDVVSGKKNIWQAMIDWILDVINQLSGGKMWTAEHINNKKMLATELDENTLAHYAASNIINLIKDSQGAYNRLRENRSMIDAKDISSLPTTISGNIVGNIPITAFDFSDEEMDEVGAMQKCK